MFCCILNSEYYDILSRRTPYEGLYMDWRMTKCLSFSKSRKWFVFIYIYSGMEDCKSSHYIWKDSTIAVCSWHTKHQFQHIQCNCMVRWQRLFRPYIQWWQCWSNKIWRNSEMAEKQIWIHSSDIQIWWHGCECGLFVFNRQPWGQKKVVISTRRVWMLV